MRRERTAVFALSVVLVIAHCGGKAADGPNVDADAAAADGEGATFFDKSPDAADLGDASERADSGAPEDTGSSAEREPPLSAEALVQGWKDAGYQRGLGVCRCVDFEPEQLVACAKAESGAAYLWSADGQRCADELARGSSDVRSYLACQAAATRDLAACESATCPWRLCEPRRCPGESAAAALGACNAAYYCGDERRDNARCNDVIECEDRSDEVGCGARWRCGDGTHLVVDVLVCNGDIDCPDGSDETFCEGNLPDRRFVCEDGTRLARSAVCDGTQDCIDGRDENLCSDDVRASRR